MNPQTIPATIQIAQARNEITEAEANRMFAEHYECQYADATARLDQLVADQESLAVLVQAKQEIIRIAKCVVKYRRLVAGLSWERR